MDGLVEELYRSVRTRFPRRSYILYGIGDLWQADLIDFQKLKRYNSGFCYILLVIDCFSKKAWAVSLKTKSGSDVTEAMQSVLRTAAISPKNLQVDNGKEFYNISFKSLMKSHNTTMYSTYTHLKAAIVERLIRTLKGKLFKKMHLNGNFRWTGLIDGIVDEYNNTVHRTIGMKPNEVNRRTANKLKNSVFKIRKVMPINTKFKVEDPVRVSISKAIFTKATHGQNWSREVFIVHRVNATTPPTYMLRDKNGEIINGAFYNQELLKTKFDDVYLIEKVLKRKGGMLYVKFYDNNKPEWVKKNALLSKMK